MTQIEPHETVIAITEAATAKNDSSELLQS